MAVQIYTFKITYADCDNKIWRIAAVSSNYTLAKLGYMILASFDTMAYHLFEMKFKGTTIFLPRKILRNFAKLMITRDMICPEFIKSERLV